MDYRKLLEYYLTSDEWDAELDFFLEGWNHRFDPYEDDPEKEHGKLYLLSDVYMEYSQKLQNAGGVFYDLHLTDEEFQRYFDARYSPMQRFSILFGKWWGLRENQIALLSKLHYRKKCSKLLHYFLCNPEVEPACAVDEFSSFNYVGKYHAELFDKRPQNTFYEEGIIVPVEEISADGTVILVETATPLPRQEMLDYVKTNIHYDTIRSRIQNGTIHGNLHYLDEIVEMIVDTQYQSGSVQVGRILLPTEEVAYRMLQLDQREVEFILNGLNKLKRKPAEWELHLRSCLYTACGSYAALRYASNPQK